LPKSRSWSVEPLFTLEPVDDATLPFNLSLPQSATKTVSVLSANSTSFTARVVGAAEDNRTTFEPVVRVLPGTVEVRSLAIDHGWYLTRAVIPDCRQPSACVAGHGAGGAGGDGGFHGSP
jgi:hypothetical protein